MSSNFKKSAKILFNEIIEINGKRYHNHKVQCHFFVYAMFNTGACNQVKQVLSKGE